MSGSLPDYGKLDRSPMFKLSLSSKELFHSNFLEWLSVVDPEKFKGLIDSMAGCGIAWPDVWRVKREYNNFDLCIVAYDQYEDAADERIDDDPDFRILVVIENKVKSIPYKEQLDRYRVEAEEANTKYWKWRLSAAVDLKAYDGYTFQDGKWYGMKKNAHGRGRKADWSRTELNGLPAVDRLEKLSKTDFAKCFCEQRSKENPVRFVLLSLADSYPDKTSIIEEKIWQICCYERYANCIKNAFGGLPDDLDSRIIKDYCDFITSLSDLAAFWASHDYGICKRFLYYEFEADGKTRKYCDSYREAKRRRIHDLYQKLKFSGLCTDLFKEIGSRYGNQYTVFPNNRKGLFKDDKAWGRNKKYICVNYAYLHGEPLLEIAVHPGLLSRKGEEYYYAIQVQGSAYEHGIQLKRKSTGDSDNDVKDVVRDLKNGTIPVIGGWMNLTGVGEWKECGQKDFNRFGAADGIYIYQKRSLGAETTGEVINRMLDDLADVVSNV